jgi:hypothetical protein
MHGSPLVCLIGLCCFLPRLIHPNVLEKDVACVRLCLPPLLSPLFVLMPHTFGWTWCFLLCSHTCNCTYKNHRCIRLCLPTLSHFSFLFLYHDTSHTSNRTWSFPLSCHTFECTLANKRYRKVMFGGRGFYHSPPLGFRFLLLPLSSAFSLCGSELLLPIRVVLYRHANTMYP